MAQAQAAQAQQGHGAVCRAVVLHDDLVYGVCLRQDAVHLLAQVFLAVVGTCPSGSKQWLSGKILGSFFSFIVFCIFAL